MGLWAMGIGGPINSGQWVGPGSFDPHNIANYEFPWRSQFKTTHPEAIVAAQIMALGGNSRNTNFGDQTTATAIDCNGFPYINGTKQPSVDGTGAMLDHLYGFPLVTPTEDLSLAQVQTANATVSYFLGLSAGTFSGQNHTLAWHVSSWSEAAQQNWVSTVVNSGLAATVLGTNNVKRQAFRMGSAKQSRFAPVALVAA